ncbi:MAG: VanW family protein [Clostridium sp.]|nr:VanW family protein [Clostridium sp.]MDU7084290.1 VanW family protein [Clostridium sp.]
MDKNQNSGEVNELPSSQDNGKKLPNKKAIIIGVSSVITVILLAVIGISVHINKTVSVYDTLIMPGVIIEDIDMSGKTKEEAIGLLNERFSNTIGDRVVTITAGDKTYTINYSDLDVQFNIEEVAEKAFKFNRELGVMDTYKYLKEPSTHKIEIEFTYNGDIINSVAATMESEINVEKQNATISKSGSGFTVTDHVVGKKLDVQALVDEINSKVASTKEGNIEVEAVINEDMPSRTREALEKVSAQISSATTYYSDSDKNRNTNIYLGAKTINGLLLMPGESFSFNTLVGDTTPDKGYMPGGVYVGNKVEVGYGGGICQVSSTFHNAVIKAGIIPDQRLNHSMPVGYMDLGMDATIAYGYIDYVFTNPFEYPIYIEGYTSSNSVTFALYSDPSVIDGKSYEFVRDVYSVTQPKTEYKDEPTWEVGKEEVEQQPSTGYKVKVYRVTYTNGVETERILMNDDNYQTVNKIVKRGTKPKTEAPAENPAG